jgi:hypothetical protein
MSPQPATTDALTALIEAAKGARYRLACVCRGGNPHCSRCVLDAAIKRAEPEVAFAQQARAIERGVRWWLKERRVLAAFYGTPQLTFAARALVSLAAIRDAEDSKGAK